MAVDDRALAWEARKAELSSRSGPVAGRRALMVVDDRELAVGGKENSRNGPGGGRKSADGC